MGGERVTLPIAKKAARANVACPRSIWDEITARLRAQAPNEACTFALTWPSVGVERATAIVGEPIWPQPGEVQATPYKLEISPGYISRALDAAIDAGKHCGVALIHTHPHTDYGRGVGEFSGRDDWYENRLFPTLTLGRPETLCASIVLGSEPANLDARIWWDEPGRSLVQPAELVRVVGPELTLFETPHSTWTDHPDPAVMDRSTRLWGKEGRRRLQNLKVGVIGAGGTGSVALIGLATMGAGTISVWDKDVLKKENLHRMLGVAQAHVGKYKPDALEATLRAVATASPFELQLHQAWGTSAQALQMLKDCDLIFSCVDTLGARIPLNDLAYVHLIPTIDVGSWVHVANEKVDAVVTHAHVWSLGIPCAWCRQTLSSYKLMREAQGAQRGVELRAPYGLQPDQTDGVEPSVLGLNMLGVGLALVEFMQVALGISDRTPRDLKFFLPEWELDESDLETRTDCYSESNAGRGDSIQILPYDPQERA
jgi:hypothetical protein